MVSRLRTIDSGYGLCGLIVPHNKHAMVGTKDGKIEIIDVGSGTRSEVVEAHGGSVRSIATIPNENGFVTGSADHDVKFWEYQFKQKPGQVCSWYLQHPPLIFEYITIDLFAPTLSLFSFSLIQYVLGHITYHLLRK